ncbi:hypothetical protein MF621_003999 (plasmid) [Bacillus velezensis]|uniref:hypothetical protein n=1 Tax=Bacillus velezensis TaxID=492670 RepID=UPI00049F3702|nr:hypothetical protein [Bacillus velezensis]KDN91279.1 hypothetical protein EF87_19615 [Bacillus amyloliquefaciens]URJ76458.1 hypothetical protein MF619_004037 [Bacillus velezensis]URJ80414.1 hypothetical protein MF621_003999 [Bacillus velezensis]
MSSERPLYINMCNDLLRNNEISHQDKFVYMMIKSMCFSNEKSYNGIAVISTEIILSLIGFNLNSKNKNSIKESMENLKSLGFICLYEDFLCSSQADNIKLSTTYFVKDLYKKPKTFTRIYQEEVYKLITMLDKNKTKMFIVFMEIVSHIFINESSQKYCYPDIEAIEKQTGINRKTIMKYISKMYEEQILYSETFKRKNGKDKNVYSRWGDRGFVRDYMFSLESGQL